MDEKYYENRAKDEGIRLNPMLDKIRSQQVPDMDLVHDISERGQLQPIVARKLSNGELELIAGYRRYLAMQALGKKAKDMEIKIIENVSDVDAVMIALSENRFRKDFDAIEEARAFQCLIKLKVTIKDIAGRVKRSESYVRDRLALLGLPKEIQDKMDEGKLDISFAEPINKLKGNEEAQKRLAKTIVQDVRSRYGVTTVERANQEVTQIKAAIKKKEGLVAKYGPCPKCGSKDIGQEEYGDKEKMLCLQCGFKWHKETKDPWEVYQIKKHAKDIGMKVEVTGPDEAKMTPQEVATIVDERRKAIEGVEKPSPRFRSNLTPTELLKPLIAEDNILRLEIDGDEVRLKLIEDKDLHFVAIAKDYRTGEKSQICVQQGWRDGESVAKRMTKVKQLIEGLEVVSRA